jgi:hypothetical protein
MKRALRLVLGLSLLCTTGLFAANAVDSAPAPTVQEKSDAPAAAPADSSPMLKTVFSPKKNNVDGADCIVACRAIYRSCRNSCAQGDYACTTACWDEWQDCKSGCSFDPPNECWPDPYPCGPY